MKKKIIVSMMCAMLCVGSVIPNMGAKAGNIIEVQTYSTKTRSAAVKRASDCRGWTPDTFKKYYPDQIPTAAAWCASFASWSMGIDVHYVDGIENRNRSCTAIAKAYLKQEQGRSAMQKRYDSKFHRVSQKSVLPGDDEFYDANYLPEKGELVLYQEAAGNDLHHIGIVESVNTSTGSITVIEGNAVNWKPATTRKRGELNQADFDNYATTNHLPYSQRSVKRLCIGTKDKADYKGCFVYAFVNPRYSDDAIWGDVNGNGSVSSSDVVALMRYIVGIDESYSLDACDMNHNGSVDAIDLLILKKFLVEN